MIPKGYPLYKGLQKPLIYRAFKGKYIYWAIGSIFCGLVFGSVMGTYTNIILAALTSLLTISAGITYTLHKQKNGLYNKTNYKGILVLQNNVLIRYEKRK